MTFAFIGFNAMVYYTLFRNIFLTQELDSIFRGISFFILPILVYFSLLIGFELGWIYIHALFIIIFIFKKIQNKKFNIYKIISSCRKIPNIFLKSQKYLVIILIFEIFYLHFYDASTNISMTHSDNLANYNWALFHSSFTEISYPPGISGFLIPLMNFINVKYFLNFIGATLGISILIVIMIILKSFMSNNQIILFVGLIVLPIFNSLTLSRIGIHGGAFFPIVVISALGLFISLSQHFKKNEIKIYLFLFFLTFLIGGLFAPHQTISLLILSLTLLIALSFVGKISPFHSLLFPFSMVAGFMFSLLYMSESRVLSISNIIFEDNPISKVRIEASQIKPNILQSFVYDFFSIKFPIRPFFESYLSSFAYIAIIFALITLFVSLKKRNVIVFVTSIFTIFYGMITQIGIFEFSYAKGRAGWNFMYLFTILLCLFITIYVTRIRPFLLFALIVLNISVLVFPPTKYRYETESALYSLRELLEVDRSSKIYLYTDFPNAWNVDRRIQIVNTPLIKLPENEFLYVLLNLQKDIPDKYLANIRKYEDRNFTAYYSNQEKLIADRLILNTNLLSKLSREDYSILISDQLYVLLKSN